MIKKEQILCKHLSDLAQTADQRDYAVFSDFLNLNEQNVFLSIADQLPPVTYVLDGGYPLAERKQVCFIPIGAGLFAQAPLCILKIVPRSIKFAEKLTHRDYLGAILNLGIVRGKIGDLILEEDSCKVICIEEIGDYIAAHLECVRHTPIACEKLAMEQFHYEPKRKEIKGSIASERLDAIISLAFHTSRSKMTGLIAGEKVFINGKVITSNSHLLKEGDIVSVRGFGKFRYEGKENQTKKGRYFVKLGLYE
ncbi:MAG: RNA-binding protein [Candidatus Fimimorpha sp.]